MSIFLFLEGLLFMGFGFFFSLSLTHTHTYNTNTHLSLFYPSTSYYLILVWNGKFDFGGGKEEKVLENKQMVMERSFFFFLHLWKGKGV
ncbi:hypothetical protein QBC38DRAFT_471718 [Podospora fimiseda]|uniref:Uncharacterized protein n=1 Tax=Podospora fimiseda TaxID=252190 RepID=A0AAN7H1Z9_9PEZI|nr:hypothetical protein QBC38DRAFT_471718 [Podospora fimiseda]